MTAGESKCKPLSAGCRRASSPGSLPETPLPASLALAPALLIKQVSIDLGDLGSDAGHLWHPEWTVCRLLHNRVDLSNKGLLNGKCIKWSLSRAVVGHTLTPSTREAEAGESLEFEASLFYRVSSRTSGPHRETLSQPPPPPDKMVS